MGSKTKHTAFIVAKTKKIVRLSDQERCLVASLHVLRIQGPFDVADDLSRAHFVNVCHLAVADRGLVP